MSCRRYTCWNGEDCAKSKRKTICCVSIGFWTARLPAVCQELSSASLWSWLYFVVVVVAVAGCCVSGRPTLRVNHTSGGHPRRRNWRETKSYFLCRLFLSSSPSRAQPRQIKTKYLEPTGGGGCWLNKQAANVCSPAPPEEEQPPLQPPPPPAPVRYVWRLNSVHGC